jgi:hypothetical protein
VLLFKAARLDPATAIGNDYRVLEQNRVVQIIPAGGGMFRMRLLKREIGQLALQVLTKGDANAEAIHGSSNRKPYSRIPQRLLAFELPRRRYAARPTIAGCYVAPPATARLD